MEATERTPENAESRPTSITRKARMRTCVGCGEVTSVAAGDPSLIRLVLVGDKERGGVAVAVDVAGGAFGRGAHVHPRPACLEHAARRGIARAAKAQAGRLGSGSPDGAIRHIPHLDGEDGPITAASLARAIRRAMDRRVEGLLRAAVRTRTAAIGNDAASGACALGEAALVVVACDGAAGAAGAWLQRAIAAGRAVAWGDRHALGELAGKRSGGTPTQFDNWGSGSPDGALRPKPHMDQGVALLAITSKKIGAALAEAVRVVDTCAAVERSGDEGVGRARRRPRGGRGGMANVERGA